MNKFKSLLFKGIGLTLVLFLAACSSSSTDSESDSQDPSAAIKGNATLSGLISVSDIALNQAQDDVGDAGLRTIKLQEATVKSRHQLLVKKLQTLDSKIQKNVINSVDDESIVPMDGGTLYVSYLDSEGNVVTTNISVEIAADGSYEITGLKDGINYILTAEKIGFDANGNINKIKSEAIAMIPQGETEVEAYIEPGSDVIMRTVISTIQETVDTLISSAGDIDSKTKEIINSLVNAVIAAVTEKIKEQIESGEIVVSTQVETVKTQSELSGLTEDEKRAEKERIGNQKTASVSTELTDTDKKLKSEIDTDENVASVVDDATSKAQSTKDLSKMTLDEAKVIIEKQFGQSDSGTTSDSNGGRTDQSKGGEGVPDFFVTQLANAYLAQKKTSVTTYATAWKQANSGETRSVEELKTAFVGQINQALTALYSYYDNGTTSNVAGFGNLKGAKIAFPSDKRLKLPINTATVLDVPQLISTFWFTGLFEDSGGDDEFDGIAFIQALGLSQIEDHKVYIIDAGIRPVRLYMPSDLTNPNNSNWIQKDALVGQISIFAQGISEEDIDRVVLRYTNQNNSVVTVELEKEEDYHNQGGDQRIQSSVAMMAKLSSAKVGAYNIKMAEDGEDHARLMMNFRLDPWQAINNEDASKIISDFKSGDVTIEVVGTDDDEVLASVNVAIYKIQMGTPTWVFPKGPDMEIVKKYGWDPDYETQLVALPDDQDTVSKLRIEWQAPTLTGSLPDGMRVAYSVFLGLQVHKKDWNQEMGDTLGLIPEGTLGRSGEAITQDNENQEYWDWADDYGNKWKHIWDSWQNNAFIFGTSITLPEKLKFSATQSDSTKNYQANYEISIRPIVIDKRGFVVWEGEESRAAFKVGQDINWSTTIKGAIVFPSELKMAYQHLQNTEGVWKVGLFANYKEKQTGNRKKMRSVFWDQDLEGPRGVLRTQDGTPLVAELGTMDQVSVNPVQVYELPAFSKSDELLKMNEDMVLKVWYDVTTAPNDYRWQGITPSTNAIDFANLLDGYNPIEENTDLEEGGIKRGQEGIVRWRTQGGAQFLSEGGEVEISGRVFTWLKGITFKPIPIIEELPTSNNGGGEDNGGNGDDNQGQNPTYEDGILTASDLGFQVTIGTSFEIDEQDDDKIKFKDSETEEMVIVEKPTENGDKLSLDDIITNLTADAPQDAQITVTDTSIGNVAVKKIHFSFVEDNETKVGDLLVFLYTPGDSETERLYKIEYRGTDADKIDDILESIELN